MTTTFSFILITNDNISSGRGVNCSALSLFWYAVKSEETCKSIYSCLETQETAGTTQCIAGLSQQRSPGLWRRISGFFLQFTLASRGDADSTGFFLEAQLWPWRGDTHSLWVILTASLCLCVRLHSLSLTVGRKSFLHFRLVLDTQS